MITDSSETVVKAAKAAAIQIAADYPIVSAYEFEFLKGEEVIRERLNGSTIYMVVQRPLTYFDNVEARGGYLYFEIADSVNEPLKCRVDFVAAGFCQPDSPIDIETMYYRAIPSKEPPHRDVAAIKLFDPEGNFIHWWSPQKLLFEMIVGGLRVETVEGGNPLAFLDFNVLYIGQSFSQKVWDRLTGHKKLQKILTVQNPVGTARAAQTNYEVSLVLLSIVGLTDIPELPYVGLVGRDNVTPILHDVDLADDPAFLRFMLEPFVRLGDEALTREVEAQLISKFKPEFNKTRYKGYPKIKGGMRDKGYSWTDVEIERLPAFLRTEHFEISTTIEEEE